MNMKKFVSGDLYKVVAQGHEFYNFFGFDDDKIGISYHLVPGTIVMFVGFATYKSAPTCMTETTWMKIIHGNKFGETLFDQEDRKDFELFSSFGDNKQ